MPIVTELVERHFATLFENNAQWQTLIADDVIWYLPYAPAIAHPSRLTGRAEVTGHLDKFLEAAQNFRFHDLEIQPFADGAGAVAEVRATAFFKPTGRHYQQNYVVLIWVRDGKISLIREYFDPIRAAKALDTAIVGLVD